MSNVLTRLAHLATDQKLLEMKVAEAEEALKEAKKHLKQVSEVDIPSVMDEAGITQFETTSGWKIKIDETLHARITVANQAKAYRWLAEHGHDRIVKESFTVEFDREDSAWAEEFGRELANRERPLRFKREKKIHPSTLRAFVREMKRDGVDFPDDLFGVWLSRAAEIEAQGT